LIVTGVTGLTQLRVKLSKLGSCQCINKGHILPSPAENLGR